VLVHIADHDADLIVGIHRGIVLQPHQFDADKHHQHGQRHYLEVRVQTIDGQRHKHRQAQGISAQVAFDEYRRYERHHKHQQQRESDVDHRQRTATENTAVPRQRRTRQGQQCQWQRDKNQRRQVLAVILDQERPDHRR